VKADIRNTGTISESRKIDLFKKIGRAKGMKNNNYISLMAMCPTNKGECIMTTNTEHLLLFLVIGIVAGFLRRKIFKGSGVRSHRRF